MHVSEHRQWPGSLDSNRAPVDTSTSDTQYEKKGSFHNGRNRYSKPQGIITCGSLLVTQRGVQRTAHVIQDTYFTAAYKLEPSTVARPN